jgi:hypothetical protein
LPSQAAICGSLQTGEGSPKPYGSLKASAKAVPSLEMPVFKGLGRFAGVFRGRQEGLVDHVCPASFSQSPDKRKHPLTIVTLASPSR